MTICILFNESLIPQFKKKITFNKALEKLNPIKTKFYTCVTAAVGVSTFLSEYISFFFL